MKKSPAFQASLSRRDFAIGMLGLGAATVVGAGGVSSRQAAAAELSDWNAAPDSALAKAEAADYTSYGMPDSWANYGEVLAKFGEKLGAAIKHVDTDMSSLEEITKFDAEQNNPVAISADIGILYGALAEVKGVVPDYMPPNAAKLPKGLKGTSGGWVATFTGVPAMVVNTDVVKTVPRRWADLLNPEYTGKVSPVDAAGGGGTDIAIFLAWAYAFGGNESNLEPCYDFAVKMREQYAAAASNTQTLEKGEVPIQLKYDFNCIAAANQLREKGVNAEVIIPDGAIYAPSALMINKYNLAKMNVAKLFLDFVLSDEAQIAFAKFGARPIRWVLGDLQLPDEARKLWLPDEHYSKVTQIPDWSQISLEDLATAWRDNVTDA